MAKILHKSSRRLSCEQCRAVDRFAIEQLAIPSCVLMENAGRNAADIVERLLKRCDQPDGVRILCGRGNNGGDGFVIARHLALRGYAVAVDLLADPATLSGDAAINYRIAHNMALPIRVLLDLDSITQAATDWANCSVLVDALLGTGFTGEVREPLATTIRLINQTKGPWIVAVDIPSGLNGDTGLPGGVAVEADHTISFLAGKIGFAKLSAKHYTGRVTVADIGAPIGNET